MSEVPDGVPRVLGDFPCRSAIAPTACREVPRTFQQRGALQPGIQPQPVNETVAAEVRARRDELNVRGNVGGAAELTGTFTSRANPPGSRGWHEFFTEGIVSKSLASSSGLSSGR